MRCRRVEFLYPAFSFRLSNDRSIAFHPSGRGPWDACGAAHNLFRMLDVDALKEANMGGTKHEKGRSPFRSDLERNPGIGQSKGSFMTGIPPEEIEGENTLEGDVDNDTTVSDGVPEEERERTNS
jgi:hypothetical protein